MALISLHTDRVMCRGCDWPTDEPGWDWYEPTPHHAICRHVDETGHTVTGGVSLTAVPEDLNGGPVSLPVGRLVERRFVEAFQRVETAFVEARGHAPDSQAIARLEAAERDLDLSRRQMLYR